MVVFSYLNPILRYGVGRFLRDAEELGIAGLLLTDLPAGRDPALESAVQRSPIDLIRLVAPTTRAERLNAAVAGAQGFVYLIARLGVTGARASLAKDWQRRSGGCARQRRCRWRSGSGSPPRNRHSGGPDG